MKSSISLLAAALVFLIACQSNEYYRPPGVTAQMGKAKDVKMLEKGRALFAHRCIECHTLPPVWHYQADDWPVVVDSMAHRASL